MKKAITIGVTILAGISLSACGNSTNKQSTNSSTTQQTQRKYYFDGKTANLHDVKIHIDHVKFYQASEETNNKNLICFDYTITNKTDKDINAIGGWQDVFNAYQDNKNTEGKLEVGILPSDTSEQVLHNQDQTIKKNGTVKCRAAYELDSTKKPVVLKASQGTDGKFLGKKVYKISKLKQTDMVSHNNIPSSYSSNKQTLQGRSNNTTGATTTSTSVSNSNNNSHTGDWHNDPELWNDVQNNDNWKGSMYQNATPQERYDYIEGNHDYWASRDPNYYNE